MLLPPSYLTLITSFLSASYSIELIFYINNRIRSGKKNTGRMTMMMVMMMMIVTKAAAVARRVSLKPPPFMYQALCHGC